MAGSISDVQAWLAAHPNDPQAPQVRTRLQAAIAARTNPSPDARPTKTTSTISPPGTVGGPPTVWDQRAPQDRAEDAKHDDLAVAAHYAAKYGLPLAGSMLGGMGAGFMGLPAGPGAVLAGAAGAGAGQGAGRYAQIGVDKMLGYPTPDPASLETAKQVLKEALIAGGTQGALGLTGVGAGKWAAGAGDSVARDTALWWAKNQGAITPAQQIGMKGTQLEGLSPEVLSEVIGLSQGGKAAVPAASSVADRLRARVPVGLAAQNASEGVPAMAQRLQGAAPQQAALNSNLKDEVRNAIAADSIRSTGQPVTQSAVTAAKPLVKPEAVQAGFESTAGYAPTAGDENALGASGAVKDFSAQLGAGWRAVNKGRGAMAAAEATGAQGTADDVQARALDAFANANTNQGLTRKTGKLAMVAAALAGNRERHALSEGSPWTQSGAVPNVASAQRALETEAISRGLPPIGPTSIAGGAFTSPLREELMSPNNPMTRAAVSALTSWLYSTGPQQPPPQ